MASLYLATGDHLEIILGQSVPVDVAAFYNEGRTLQSYAAAGTYTIFDAAGGVDIPTLLITNISTTTSVDVTVRLRTKNSEKTIQLTPKVTLDFGATLNFADGNWQIPEATMYPVELFRLLTADDTAANATSAQPWFPTTGAVNVEASSTYYFDGHLAIVSVGATTHTTATAFGGTATITAIDYVARIIQAAEETLIASSAAGGGSFIRGDDVTALVLNATSTAVEHNIDVQGIVRINAAGTFIPQFKYSADPTGTQAVQRGTWFRMRKLPSTTWGTWS